MPRSVPASLALVLLVISSSHAEVHFPAFQRNSAPGPEIMVPHTEVQKELKMTSKQIARAQQIKLQVDRAMHGTGSPTSTQYYLRKMQVMKQAAPKFIQILSRKQQSRLKQLQLQVKFRGRPLATFLAIPPYRGRLGISQQQANKMGKLYQKWENDRKKLPAERDPKKQKKNYQAIKEANDKSFRNDVLTAKQRKLLDEMMGKPWEELTN